MDVWHYHPETKELLGAGKADPCPVEPGAWLLPAHTTPVAPPARQDGHAIVFAGSSWAQAPDHRGETWWMADDKPTIVTAIGDPAAFDPPLTNMAPPAPPVAPLPVMASPRQIRQALTLLGLREAVERWVQGADQDTRDNWQYATEFKAGGSPVDAALEELGTAPEDVALLFEVAKSL